MSAPPELDVRRIVGVLVAHRVEFVIIGGIAAILHGSARNTMDFDVYYATDPTNLERLGNALVDLEGRLRGVDDDIPFVPDAATLRTSETLVLRTPAGDFDVLARPAGAADYATVRERADMYDIGDGVVVPVASVPDLIAMKRAAGRDKDRDDVATLEAILRLRAV